MTTVEEGLAVPRGRADETFAPDPRHNRSLRGRASTLAAMTFLGPNLVMVLVFLIIPLGWAFVLSFQKVESLGPSLYAGVNNYVDLFQDSTFYRTLFNTVVFTLGTVPVGMAIGLGIAVLLNGVLPGRVLFRSIIFLPLVISGVSTGLLGAWMFDQYNGFVNKFLDILHITGPAWQSNGSWAMTSVILMTLWQRIGFDMLIYLAGLQALPVDVLEAATIDGASPWQRFRTVVLPLLGPSTFFLLIMNLIYSFQVFDTVYAMTAGGPNYSTTFLVTYAYRTGFDEKGPGELGYAATVGVVIFLVTLLITTAQWRSSKNRDQVA
ncbi:carbohydrate ABC transporter permease [Jatrophihabitans sp. YIM 134969]